MRDTSRQTNDNFRTLSILLLCLVLGVAGPLGCGDDGGGQPDPGHDAGDVGADSMQDAGTNSAPQAEATVSDGPYAVGERVQLDASGSSDPDGDTLQFSWSVQTAPQGSSASLDDASMAETNFVADEFGRYEVAVEVSDGTDTDTAELEVDVYSEPVADAGADQTGMVGDSIQFDGSASSSPGGESLEYQWEFVARPDGSSASFDDPTATSASFTPDVEGVYVAELTVSNAATSATDRVSAQVAPEDGRLTNQVFVAPDGNDSNPGTESDPVATVDAALQIFRDVDSVGRIVLDEGTYDIGSAAFQVARDLDIVGPEASDASAVIEGTGTLFEVNSDAFLTLVDVEVRTDSIALSVGDDAAVSLTGVDCEADTCILSGGLLSSPGGRIEVDESTLLATNDSTNAVSAVQPDAVSVNDTTVRGFESPGILVIDGPVTVRNSSLEDNATGIELIDNESSDATRIADTSFAGNDRAIAVSTSQNVTLDGVSVSQAAADSVVVDASAVVVRDSTITDGGNHGIRADGAAVLTVRRTDITDNQGSGIRVEGDGARIDLGDQSEPADNSIYGHSQAQIYDARPDGASGEVTLNGTGLGQGMTVLEPPAGTYSGPGFDNYGIVIENDTSVTAY